MLQEEGAALSLPDPLGLLVWSSSHILALLPAPWLQAAAPEVASSLSHPGRDRPGAHPASGQGPDQRAGRGGVAR